MTAGRGPAIRIAGTEPLTRIATLLDAQQLTTNVGTVLPLADARVAHEMLEGTRPHRRGKIALTVRSDPGPR
jgi:NADPH:quinone reductase-like Zn-dependent oxidoreductase